MTKIVISIFLVALIVPSLCRPAEEKDDDERSGGLANIAKQFEEFLKGFNPDNDLFKQLKEVTGAVVGAFKDAREKYDKLSSQEKDDLFSNLMDEASADVQKLVKETRENIKAAAKNIVDTVSGMVQKFFENPEAAFVEAAKNGLGWLSTGFEKLGEFVAGVKEAAGDALTRIENVANDMAAKIKQDIAAGKVEKNVQELFEEFVKALDNVNQMVVDFKKNAQKPTEETAVEEKSDEKLVEISDLLPETLEIGSIELGSIELGSLEIDPGFSRFPAGDLLQEAAGKVASFFGSGNDAEKKLGNLISGAVDKVKSFVSDVLA